MNNIEIVFRWIRYLWSSFPFPAAIFRDSPSHHSDGYDICGARGDLYTTMNGPTMDYENTQIAHDKYYYKPLEDCIFVDLEGLDERKTATGETRRYKFRQDIVQRDGNACVVTAMAGRHCEAAHLIRHSKGDDYIKQVIQRRSRDVSAPEAQIDMTENGILIRWDMHSMLSSGEVAFIQTPNYELRPEDIKRFSRGDEREPYITLQWIKTPGNFDSQMLQELEAIQNAGIVPSPVTAHNALQNVDALFGGSRRSLPSSVILDYVYGIAAYNAWRVEGDSFNDMKAYHKAHYAQIAPASHVGDPNDFDDPDEPDDPNDRDYTPKSHKHPSTSGLEETMEELNMILMYMHGITPEMAAERHRKEIEEQEAQEVGRNNSKVMGWKSHLPAVFTEMYS